MKTLSVRNPWAWAIFHGKPVENRTWDTAYRGPVLIHAGKAPDTQDGWRACAEIAGEPPSKFWLERKSNRFSYGGIIGVAWLGAVIEGHGSAMKYRTSDKPFLHQQARSPWGLERWYFGPFGFVLSDQMELPFFPAAGQLGLFEFDELALPDATLALLQAWVRDDGGECCGEKEFQEPAELRTSRGVGAAIADHRFQISNGACT